MNNINNNNNKLEKKGKKMVMMIWVMMIMMVMMKGGVEAQKFVVYVDGIDSWWPPSSLAAALSVPGYSPPNLYNTINLGFWLTGGAVDAAEVWENALTYCSTTNPWGNTTAAIQSAWLSAYHANGKSVLVSAFGSTEYPTTAGIDPITSAQSLAQFVITNQLDGVDVDYEDNSAMNNGTGVDWLISFTNELRSLLPSSLGYIITHAPQAPYFMSSYPEGGYLAVDKGTDGAIDWYNVQFYNQISSDYLTYETLFEVSDGWATNTAVMQLVSAGVDMNKIVVGKPIALAGVDNTGFVSLSNLTSIFTQALSSTSWNAGVMGWEFDLDLDGVWINTLAPLFN